MSGTLRHPLSVVSLERLQNNNGFIESQPGAFIYKSRKNILGETIEDYV